MTTEELQLAAFSHYIHKLCAEKGPNVPKESVPRTKRKSDQPEVAATTAAIRAFLEPLVRAGFPQSDIAKLARVSTSSLSRVLKGTDKPTISFLNDFAAGLGLDFEELKEGNIVQSRKAIKPTVQWCMDSPHSQFIALLLTGINDSTELSERS